MLGVIWALLILPLAAGLACAVLPGPAKVGPLVTGTSGLVLNANGSVDIYIRNRPPPDNESMNWLPAPTGDFLLFLRIYLPGQAVLNGTYKPPPLVKVS